MTQQMNAVVVDAPGRIDLVRRDVPKRGEGDVLIRIRRAGICGTDYHIFTGQQPFLTYPRLIGHELSGIVEAAPSDSAFAPGEIVTIIPYIACGACHACTQGKPNCCMKISVLGVHRDGGMCEFLSVPERNVLAVVGLTLDEAATVEFLAIGAHAVRRAGDLNGRATLVVGAGPIGLAVAIMAGIGGASVTLADIDPARLALAAQIIPLASTLVADGGFPQAVLQATGSNAFDLVFDATGNRASMERGFTSVAHGGTYVFAGLIKDYIMFSDSEFHKREVTLMASRNATIDDFELVISSIRSGAIPVARLLTHRTTLAKVAQVLPGWVKDKTGLVKALVEIA